MANTMSAHARTAILQQMAEQPLDLLVIGGGITGAGIALDAQVRGLRTGLIEMQDFAAGTSSRSTKLVHGGLRYLKQLEFKLVAEVGKERNIVYENAPHVTTPIRMLLPFYEGGTFGRWSTSIGLWVYDLLAQVERAERRVMLTREETLARVPILKQEGLIGAGDYVEYRTDDARLTLEIMKSAVQRGAKAVNYAKVTRLLYEQQKVIGAEVTDQLSGQTWLIRAHSVINAAGPWVDQVREMDQSKQGKTLHLTKGVHLVFDGARLPLSEALYFDTPFRDKRMIFVIPRDGKTYVGTTDTNYAGNMEHPETTEEDIEYLLAAVNGMFPGQQLTRADIESDWAGLRPLIHEEGKSPSELSRKDEIWVSPSGLLSIAGGKLTGYRKMAEKAVDHVAKKYAERTGVRLPGCSTAQIRLSGGYRGGSQEMKQRFSEQIERGVALGLEREVSLMLCQRYGANVEEVFRLLGKMAPSDLPPDISPTVAAVIQYSMTHEMAVTVEDVLVRRTSAKWFQADWAASSERGIRGFMEQVKVN